MSKSDNEDFYQDPGLNKYVYKKNEIDEYLKNNSVVLSYETRVILSDLQVCHKAEILKKLKELTFMDSGKYLQWVNNLLRIPFGKFSPPLLKEGESPREFIDKSKKILDSVVYKQEETKKMIIDFCCKLISNPSSKGSVLGLCSSKGMGKTKIIRQGLSKILNRPFYSISFGGLTDPMILSGHDYTYSGSTYGRIVDIIIKSGVMDPIIYLDEIDKIGSDVKSIEIFGVLTHLLDEEQNSDFHDNYFQGIPIDLSKVLFVTSFNDISNISNIVSDRMKIINIPELSFNDKKYIVRHFLIKDVLQDVGINNSDLDITDQVIEYIINRHSEEKGMRKIKKDVETLIERFNQNILYGELTLPVKIDIKSTKQILVNFDKIFNHMYV